MTLAPPPYTLVRRAAAGGAPLLDPGQRAVVAHRGGPLLVLAGPGTGKTTTLVEAVLDRMSGEGAVRPEEILVLTFSRAAAAELRDRIGARLGETVGVPGATTFHSFCFALLGRFKDPALFSEPLRLLSGPEQDVVIRELVRGTIDPLTGWQAPAGSPDAARWPAALRAALGTRGFAQELRAVLLRAREQGLDPARLREFAERADREDWRAAARFFAEYLDVTDARGVLDYAELVHRAVLSPRAPRCASSCAPPTAWSSWTNTRTPIRRRSDCWRRSPGTAGSWSWWAIPTSRSTPSAARICTGSWSSPTDSARTGESPRRSPCCGRVAAPGRRCCGLPPRGPPDAVDAGCPRRRCASTAS